MSFWSGFAQGLTQALNGQESYGRIERCCEQLGWGIDERDGDTLGLNFKCPVTGRRTVYINSGNEPLVFFIEPSLVVVPPQKSDDGHFILGYALLSNNDTRLGKWQARFNKRQEVLLTLTYTALGDGLSAAALKYICTTMS